MTPLNPRRVNYANSRGNNAPSIHRFNCYGATRFVLGQAKRLYWTTFSEMQRWLDDNTIKIYRPSKPGDIVTVHVYRDKWLQHTAVYIGNGKYFHKKGSNISEITDLKGIRQTYDGVYAYRRLTEVTA